MKFARASFATALVLGAGLTLSAGEPARWGFQGGIALPVGDLGDIAGPGLEGGAHLQWNFGRGHGLITRADLTFYGNKDGYSNTSLGGGADYTYHLGQEPLGLYLLGGLSILNFNTSPPEGSSDNRSSLGLDLGVGYDMSRNLGFQARYTSHSSSGRGYNTMNLGVLFTF